MSKEVKYILLIMISFIIIGVSFTLLLILLAMENQPVELNRSTDPPIIFGYASWYDYDCLYGECKTKYCSLDRKIEGKCYSQQNLTCASRDFPRETILMITNTANGKQVTCRVNDYVENPDVIIDLSSKTFKALAPLSIGIINVEIEIIN